MGEMTGRFETAVGGLLPPEYQDITRGMARRYGLTATGVFPVPGGVQVEVKALSNDVPGFKAAVAALDRELSAALSAPRVASGSTSSAPPTGTEANDAARRVLMVLYRLYEAQGDRRWGISADADELDATGLDVVSRKKALARLADKGLVKRMTLAGAYSLEPDGLEAMEQPDLIDELLPVRSPGAQPATVTATSLAELRDRLGWLREPELVAIVQRDIDELEGALTTGLHKTAIILAGAVLECVLIDVLDRRRDLASPYLKKRRFPDDASLDDLIAIAGDADLVGDGHVLLGQTACQVGVVVKDHRDLIHPHRELRMGTRVDADTANAMVALLRLVVRDLAQAHTDGIVKRYEDK